MMYVDLIEFPLPKGTFQDSLEQIAEDNWIIFFRAVSRGVRVSTAGEALAMLLSSRRIFHDINWALLHGHQMQLVIRKWWVDINPEWEFRVFAWNNVLTAGTQYNDVLSLL
eukprot:TRINITY_DN106_c0_g1_i11.p1 TRINITY_DN106_c0_g1~~TRINITY_DN106_c0_g1_i11.p1  ORF type:complete len:111 (+),score=16.38 TRINITY_DN106_c0_g1_i11:150-482(+)